MPLLVTVKPSWNPPLHELVKDQVAEQPAEVPEALAEGDALGDWDVDGDCDGDWDWDGDGEADAEAEAEADADGDCDVLGVADGEGEEPVPFDSTTIDSAGTDTELPEKLVVVMAGLAALYVYSVSVELVRPRLDVLTV